MQKFALIFILDLYYLWKIFNKAIKK